MKVLQINSVCGVGSTGRIVTDIHNILKNEGHESYIAYGRKSAENCKNTIKIGSKKDIYLHGLKTRIFDRHGFGSKKATEEFIAKIRNIDPDIIHLHNIHGYYINIEILFKFIKKNEIPVAWTLHDCWPFTGHCSHFDFINCRKWQEQCTNCPQIKEYPMSLFLDNSMDNYKKKKQLFTGLDNMILITPSNWLCKLLKNSFLKEYPIEVIHNGIDLKRFKYTRSNFRKENGLDDKFIILGVANKWGKKKGYNYFIQLSKIISDQEKIIIVGLTSKQKSDLPDNIVGITRTDNIEELVEIYSASDVFINPTLEDNFPTTNLEALACGIPVITFDTGGSSESINSTLGYVIKDRNIHNLTNAIYKMKNNKHKFSRKKIRIEVEKRFNKLSQFHKYIEIYKSLLN